MTIRQMTHLQHALVECRTLVVPAGQSTPFCEIPRRKVWICLSGTGLAARGTVNDELREGVVVEIIEHELHRITNRGPGPLIVTELIYGTY